MLWMEKPMRVDILMTLVDFPLFPAMAVGIFQLIIVVGLAVGSFLLMIRQVGARKKADESLRKSNQKLALHMGQTPLAVIEWNDKFEVTEWNPAAERIFGYTE